MKPFAVFSLIVLLMLAFSCSQVKKYPDNVQKALENAGENRVELEKALEYFASWNDTLKIQAAYYLIGNMEGHCYATYKLCDTLGNSIPFDASTYDTFEQVIDAADSLEVLYGALDFEKDTLIYDLTTMSSDFLINQIDYAFRAWRGKPWAGGISLNAFLEYVLPYRGSNEPLEPWREYFYQRYSMLDTIFTDTTDAITVASYVNDDIKSWFAFDRRYYYHPTDQGLSEMLQSRYGRCEDMTNLTIYAMRAIGLAVTSDYTPYWANAGGNHAWNALVMPAGEVIPFMGAESNPGNYSLPNKMAKVYRKMFSEQPENLIFQDNKQEKVPGWLRGKSYVDVTPAYTRVCDVVYNFPQSVPDSVDYAYLCVFNSGKWQAVHWGKVIGDAAAFNDMGTDIIYLPALYLNEEITPYGLPFILHDNCAMELLQPDLMIHADFDIGSVAGFKPEIATDGVHKINIENDKSYELYFWHDGWQSLGKSKAKSQRLHFANVPQGALYWLVAEDSDKDERIFTFDNGRQLWW